MASGTGSPCGACKFLRRKCTADCVFAPHFCSEQGPAIFAAIHKVFGASNVSKLLLHVPARDRPDAICTISYEAQARIRDPIHGCVSHIFALQQQVEYLQAQLMQTKAQLIQNLQIDDQKPTIDAENYEWPISSSMFKEIGSYSTCLTFPNNYINYPTTHHDKGLLETQNRDIEQVSFQIQPYNKKRRPSQTELSELQQLALRMMKSEN